VILTRRPLASLADLGESMSAREPHKSDRLSNAIRRLNDRFGARRFERGSYNRRQRALYHGRMPTATRKARPGAAGHAGTDKRMAPEKRIGMRLRQR